MRCPALGPANRRAGDDLRLQVLMRVLLVEDNRRLAGFVVSGLQDAGFVVDAVGSADEGDAALRTVDYDVLVLDLSLPDYDGLVLLRNLRVSGASTPVLILTARDHVDDRVKGLNLGADDYLLKPFALEELIARLRALLRRPSETLSSVTEIGNMRFDVVTRELKVDGAAAALSRRESDVLEVLARRVGRVVPKRTLDEKIHGFGSRPSRWWKNGLAKRWPMVRPPWVEVSPDRRRSAAV